MNTNSPTNLLLKSIGRYLKRKPLLSFLALVAMYTSASAQNSANIIVQPASTLTSVGQSFTVTVKVDFTTAPATSSIDAAEVHLTFDHSKLQVTSITKPGASSLPIDAIPLQAIGDNSTPNTINYNGQINYAAFTFGGFPSADFDLLSITFNVTGGGTTSTPLTFLTTLPNKTDAQRSGSSILGSVTNGTVNINPAGCTPPTGIIAGSSATSTCNGQPVSVKLTSATGTSPYKVVVNGTTYTNVTVGSPFATIDFPSYKLWASTNPAAPRQNDGSSIETGNKFTFSQGGFIKGVRFYNGTGTYTLGTYKGKIWNFATGALLGSITYTGVTAGGWFEAMFSTPIAVAANTTYLVTVFSSAGNYVATDNSLTNAISNGPVSTVANNVSPNGMYIFSTEQSGPSTNFGSWQSFQATNYWTDVIFTQNTNALNVTSITDAGGCSNFGSLQTLNVNSVSCSTLPVTLLNLSASPSGRNIILRWSTSTELNSRGFDVQRSLDGSNWTTVGFVAGAGNSTDIRNYTYSDNNLESRKYYYRIKEMDIDDHSKYSVTVSATLGSKGDYSLGQNYPNPFRSETTIQYTIAKAEQVNISLFDMSGRTVRVLVSGSKEAGTHAVIFNTGTLTNGVYYYKIQAGDFTDVKKLTIQ